MAPSTLAGLQAALAGENGAVYAYGVIGAYAEGPALTRATNLWNAHKARRDDLRAMITAAGATPAAADPAYRLPRPVTGPATAQAAAAEVEASLIPAYVGLAGAADPALRLYAAQAMQQAMTRTLSWGGTVPSAFPGLPTPPPTTRP